MFAPVRKTTRLTSEAVLSFFTSIASFGWEVPSFTTVPAPSSSEGGGDQSGTGGGPTAAGEEEAVPMGAQIRR